MHLNCSTHKSDGYDLEDPGTCDENRFYSNDDASDQTMPSKHMSEENHKKMIPMVAECVEKNTKTKRGCELKVKVKLFKILLDSCATSNLIVDYLAFQTSKTEKNAMMFTTTNRKFIKKSHRCNVYYA